jgi:hypothetical protein
MAEEIKSRYLFYAEFSDGYSFRNLIEYLKSTNTNGNFIFHKDGISYSQHNNSNSLLNFIELRGYDLPVYFYRSSDEFIRVGINLSNLRSITKSVGKKDSIRIYMLCNNPLLHISISSPNTKELNRNNVSVIRPQKLEVIQYDIDEYKRDESSPNCTTPAFDFNKMCSAMNALKCSHIVVYGDESSIVFKGMFDGDLVGRTDTFGITKKKDESHGLGFPSQIPEISEFGKVINPTYNEVDGPVINKQINYQHSIKIDVSTIKALGKLNNLSPNGTIKMYMEEGLPFKMISNVGSYGKLTIFLRDIPQEDN